MAFTDLLKKVGSAIQRGGTPSKIEGTDFTGPSPFERLSRAGELLQAGFTGPTEGLYSLQQVQEQQQGEDVKDVARQQAILGETRLKKEQELVEGQREHSRKINRYNALRGLMGDIRAGIAQRVQLLDPVNDAEEISRLKSEDRATYEQEDEYLGELGIDTGKVAGYKSYVSTGIEAAQAVGRAEAAKGRISAELVASDLAEGDLAKNVLLLNSMGMEQLLNYTWTKDEVDDMGQPFKNTYRLNPTTLKPERIGEVSKEKVIMGKTGDVPTVIQPPTFDVAKGKVTPLMGMAIPAAGATGPELRQQWTDIDDKGSTNYWKTWGVTSKDDLPGLNTVMPEQNIQLGLGISHFRQIFNTPKVMADARLYHEMKNIALTTIMMQRNVKIMDADGNVRTVPDAGILLGQYQAEAMDMMQPTEDPRIVAEQQEMALRMAVERLAGEMDQSNAGYKKIYNAEKAGLVRKNIGARGAPAHTK